MAIDNLFQALVEIQLRNLDKCRPNIRNGRVHSERFRGPIPEGKENELYDGVLIVKNGNTTLDRLLKDGWIKNDVVEGFADVKNKEELGRYFDTQEGCDGAYIMDSVNDRITRVYELNNNKKTGVYDFLKASLSSMLSTLGWQKPIRPKLEEFVPADFVRYGNKTPVQGKDIGTKTRLAIKWPLQYGNVETYQIKRSAYTPLGMGKVTRFNKHGLAEEFFLKPENEGIVGVHRKYRHEGGKIVLDSEEVVNTIRHAGFGQSRLPFDYSPEVSAV
jgi:hypothetical protein